MTGQPITKSMDAALGNTSRAEPAADVLLRHCFALGGASTPRPPVKARLEALLGPDLARRLVASLTATRRR